MTQISEVDAKTICYKFFDNSNYSKREYVNHSKHGFNPILILVSDENNILHLFDNYFDVLSSIKKNIEADLIKNGGYSQSFYLSLEDIDNLDLQDYVSAEHDIEKVLDAAKDVLRY